MSGIEQKVDKISEVLLPDGRWYAVKHSLVASAVHLRDDDEGHAVLERPVLVCTASRPTVSMDTGRISGWEEDLGFIIPLDSVIAIKVDD